VQEDVRKLETTDSEKSLRQDARREKDLVLPGRMDNLEGGVADEGWGGGGDKKEERTNQLLWVKEGGGGKTVLLNVLQSLRKRSKNVIMDSTGLEEDKEGKMRA